MTYLGWAYKERDGNPPLAIGDAYLEGSFRRWSASTAIAQADGVMQVAGLDLDRRGRMRARQIVLRVSWPQVRSFWQAEITVPDEVTRHRVSGYHGPTKMVALELRDLGPPEDHLTLVVLQNLEQWTDACSSNGVQEEPGTPP